jgi:formamidopyrimidine-DNA glycosylase
MPELPEVEAARRLAQRVAAGRRIAAVWCAADAVVLDGIGPARVRRALVGRRILAARRHGKHLWLELDRRPWPILHFGMSGGLYAPGRGVRLVAQGRNDRSSVVGARGAQRRASVRARRRLGVVWPPRFTKLRLTFEDGGELAFADPRRLGRLRLRDDPRHDPPIGQLGFDAYCELPPLSRFFAALHARAAPIKAVLLDQTFAAGVGNWVADEVLYQARIDPRRPARRLTAAEAGRLRVSLRSVLATAVRAGADSDRYPRTWLFHRRWDRNVTTARGEAIRHQTIGGRTAAWVPAVQR